MVFGTLIFSPLLYVVGDFEQAIGVGNLLLAKHPNDSTLSFEVGALQVLLLGFDTRMCM
jgi:hypothetical protein